MATLGTAANVFGVITPAKDVVEVIKAIAESVEEVKRNRTKVSELIEMLKHHLKRLDAAILLYTRTSDRQRQSLLDLHRSLVLMLKELVEQSQSNSVFFGFSFSQWWNSGDIKMRLKRLEKKIRLCHELFVFDSLTHIVHTVDSTLISIQSRLINSSDNIEQSDQVDRMFRNGQRTGVECTAIMWKTPMKADFSDPKILNYIYFSNKVSVLLGCLKSSSGWIECLLQNNTQNFVNIPNRVCLHPIGDPIRECEDASGKAIRLSRMIQEQSPHVSAVEWFDDLSKLAVSVNNMGLVNEALQIRQFEYHILTLLASEQGSNVDSRLASCLYNIAALYFGENHSVKAVPLLERAAEIQRRLGARFIPDLATSLRLLSRCFRCLSQFEEATKPIQESVALFRELASNDPSRYSFPMADCLTDKAFYHYDLCEYQIVIDCCEEAIQYFALSSPQPKEDFPYDYARTRWIAALAHKELGNFGTAEQYGREAVVVFNRLIHDRPMCYLSYSKSTYLSDWYREMGRSQDAICILEQSLTVYCSIMPSPAVQKEFANTVYRRVEILLSNDKFSEALDALSQVIEIRRHFLEEEEEDFSALADLLSAFNLRCSCLVSLCRQPEAIKSIEMAVDILHSSLTKAELRGSEIASILQKLISQESMLERMDSTEAVNNLREFKKSLLCIDEAILVFRQRILDGKCSHSNLACLLELRCRILSRIRKFDIALLSIQEAVSLFNNIFNRKRVIGSRTNLIRVLVCQAYCQNKMKHLDDTLATIDEALTHIRSISGNYRSREFLDFFIDVVDCHDSLTAQLIVLDEYLKVLDTTNKSLEILNLLNVDASCT